MVSSRPLKTLDDFMALGDEVRAELIAGEIYMTPTPSADHQAMSGNLFFALECWRRQHDEGALFAAPLDVHLPSGDVVQPDLIYVRPENMRTVQRWIHGVPDLLVEIVSPTGAERDRIVKRELYALNGVAEYWIMDGAVPAIERLTLEDGEYAAAGYFRSGDVLATEQLPGLELAIADVFATRP